MRVNPPSLHFVPIGADGAVVTFDRTTHKSLNYELDVRQYVAVRRRQRARPPSRCRERRCLRSSAAVSTPSS
jgi:hypothetical protein